MARFTKIVVHFETSRGPRRAVIKVKPEEKPLVSAIFLDDSHKELVPKRDPKKLPPPPVAVRVEDEAGVKTEIDDDDGPGVCYLIEGVLHCW